jgi:hypothetical protein
VAEVHGAGVVRIVGTPVDLSSKEDLDRRIKPGARLQVPEGAEINLMAGKTLAMLVTAGTDMTVPSAPARWFDRQSDVRIRHGILRFATGPAFHGASLTVHTPEARAEVTGTVFTVIRDPEIGTCVCVYQGTVRVGRQTGEDMVMVPAGMRRIVYADERPPVVRTIRTDERGYLRQYGEEMDSIMK